MKKRKFALLTVTIATATLLQACSIVGGRRGPPGGMGAMPGGAGEFASPSRLQQLQRFDADTDGNISRDEFDKVLKSDFALADVNGDGGLSAQETRAVNDRLLTVRDISPILDWNADSRVDLAEFGAQWRSVFESADADRDGIVTKEELMRRPPMPRGGPPGGGPPGGGPPGGGPPGGGRPGGGRPGG